MKTTRLTVLGALVVLLASSGSGAVAGSTYRVVPTSSTVEVRTDTSGLFGGFGHGHHVVGHGLSGQVELDLRRPADASVQVSLSAASLKIVDNSDANEAVEIQHNMEGPKVLDVTRFPSIEFHSTAVEISSIQGKLFHLKIAGTLDLHGIGKSLTLPVDVLLDRDVLVASGEFSVIQQDFGIQPISAGLGLVKVADRVKIRFRIRAIREHSSSR